MTAASTCSPSSPFRPGTVDRRSISFPQVEPLREYNGDKIVVALDPEMGTLPLELAYRLARARVLLKRSDADGIDAAALRVSVERAVAALGEERKVKQQLTGAKTSIDKAYEIVEAMAARVRGHLDELDAVLRTANGDIQLELDG